MSGDHATDRERQFLIENGALTAADLTPEALAETNAAVERAIEGAAAGVRANALTLSEAANLLGWPQATFMKALAAGDLYAIPNEPPSDAPLFPRWQFQDGNLVPYLREVVAALPVHEHPLDVEHFMMQANPDYLDNIPPVVWLTTGRELGPVLRYADNLSWD